MRRILFVDDDPSVLEGLRDMLSPRAVDWDMTFALGGSAALEALDGTEFDVVVADLRMPDVGGTTLLARVQELQPQTVRIVFTGPQERQSALQVSSVAHGILSKPCRPDDVHREVERACDLQGLLHEEGLRRKAAGVGDLPSVPRIYAAVNDAIDDPYTSAADIAEILEQDMAMSAKVLQVVNSAFFGPRRRIVNISEAVSYLGLVTLRSLILSTSIFERFSASRIPGFSIDGLQRHSVVTARIASRIVDSDEAETAFTASLLHDVGKLILAAHEPDLLRDAIATARQEAWPLYAVEQARRETTHAEAGAYLLGLWGLPTPVVQAVAHHHAPRRVADPTFDATIAVYVANILAHEAEKELPDPNALSFDPLDEELLAEIGVADLLPAWRRLGRQALRELIMNEI